MLALITQASFKYDSLCNINIVHQKSVYLASSIIMISDGWIISPPSTSLRLQAGQYEIQFDEFMIQSADYLEEIAIEMQEVRVEYQTLGWHEIDIIYLKNRIWMNNWSMVIENTFAVIHGPNIAFFARSRCSNAARNITLFTHVQVLSSRYVPGPHGVGVVLLQVHES